ncbi:hypothetical protein CY35_17G037600 [Sphagnum magellanicum]|nr:hypothetical protein CY35_17G037600 [Sphagnum magellanicum]KAH9535128.1 hypothetical protein CY35_17G037600 [Sphagnum magellanicum]
MMAWRTCLLLFVMLALCWNKFSVSADGYRAAEERQRKQEEEKGRVHCSRSRSRTVQEILSKYLLPFVEIQKYNLSSNSCRLHPNNDIFHEQEEKIEHLRPMQWQCGYCHKVFRTQTYLDSHFDNRHSSMLGTSANRCLADFCGALHCDYVDGLSNSKWKKTTCKPAVVDRNRHLCEVLANNCFPKEQSAAAQWLNDFFKRQFCDAHTCDKQLQPFPHGSVKREDSSLYFAICILTLFILAIVYFVVCLQNRDLSMTRISLRRLSQHTHIKMRKAKLT